MKNAIEKLITQHSELVEFKSIELVNQLLMTDLENKFLDNEFKVVAGELNNGKNGFMVFKDNDLFLKFDEGFPDDDDSTDFIFDYIENKTQLIIASSNSID